MNDSIRPKTRDPAYLPGMLTRRAVERNSDLHRMVRALEKTRNSPEGQAALRRRRKLARNAPMRARLRARWERDLISAVRSSRPPWSSAEQVELPTGEVLSHFDKVESVASDLDARYFDLWAGNRAYIRRALPGELGEYSGRAAVEVFEIAPGYRLRYLLDLDSFDKTSRTESRH